MNKIKKFYVNNRIYCILMLISIICVITIGTATIIYFVKQTKASEYGTRLEYVSNYEVKSDLDAVSKFLKETAKVTDVSTRLQGKIIYVTIKVTDDATQEEVQNMATSTLDLISSENKEFYDVQYIVMRPSYDAYFGSKSSSNVVITWGHTYDTSINEAANEKN